MRLIVLKVSKMSLTGGKFLFFSLRKILKIMCLCITFFGKSVDQLVWEVPVGLCERPKFLSGDRQ